MAYPQTPWTLKGYAVQTVQLVDREKARSFVPPGRQRRLWRQPTFMPGIEAWREPSPVQRPFPPGWA
jgi:hypothetical protein